MVNTTFERKSANMLGYDYKAQEKLGVVHTFKLLNIHVYIVLLPYFPFLVFFEQC